MLRLPAVAPKSRHHGDGFGAAGASLPGWLQDVPSSVWEVRQLLPCLLTHPISEERFALTDLAPSSLLLLLHSVWLSFFNMDISASAKYHY